MKFAIIIAVMIMVVVLSVFMGRYSVSLSQFLEMTASYFGGYEPNLPKDVKMVFTKIRLPRIAVAMLAGAGLSGAGCACQGIFRNPMVSPDILGATAGSGFGAAIGILLGFPYAGVQAISFCTGLLAVLMAYCIGMATGSRNDRILPLVLSGIVVTALFRSGISLVKTTADPFNKLPAITFWLLGSLSATTSEDILHLLIPVALGTIPLLLVGWRINLLSFGDEEAAAMGVQPARIRVLVILCSSVITSAVVSVGGLIEWVGLVMPHLARMIVGPDYKALLPASMLLGGAFLLLVDDIARSLLASEISLGILTAMIGSPFFIYLMFKEKRQENEP